jgi:hypothetical protein
VAFALILQFYSNYIIMVANLPALVGLAWLLRKQGPRTVLRVAAAAGIALAAALPWLLYARSWGQTVVFGGENYFRKAWWYLLEFHFHFIPLCLLLLPLIGLIRARKAGPVAGLEPARPWNRFLLFWLLPYFVIVVLTPGFYLRYLLPLMPVACLLAAVWTFQYVRWRAGAILLIAVLALSNLCSVATAYPFREKHSVRFPLLEFVKGLSVPYVGRLDDAIAFFQREAQPGESVLAVEPEFPLMFYTPLVIINGEIMGPAAGQMPKWILTSSVSGVETRDATTLPDYLKPYYEEITISVHDSVRGDSLPEPDIYQYHSVQTREPFIIYRLKTGADARPVQ